MNKRTRRQFFIETGCFAGALALQPLMAKAQDTSAPLDMVVCKWKGEPIVEEPTREIAEKLTKKAIESLGGMGRFIKKGDVVWIKPNMAWDRTPEQAANTNPDLLRTVIELCFNAGAKTVKIGDNTVNDATKSYVTSGIANVAKETGAELIYIDRSRFKETDIGGERVKKIPLYPEIIESDIVIDIPVAKHHASTTVTLAMKNYMGVIENRRMFHQDLPTCIKDITAYMKPKISILDAIRVLTANGPTGGDLKDVKRLNIVAVSTDIVALDAFGSEILGYEPQKIGTVMKGFEAGLGQIDYKNKLKFQEIIV
ncbi:MAG TPA: DUF362 domain-containing protein [Candidatus Hydrogenedens sp.]|nr:DUF362 domain-containing protein [Candidatus Hydrogenedens sp.]HOK08800.1 DUF362 domain-containing protein [Candidatus Hydrogenedens sp.]HOL18714.1 DUF362 domain-containing protein [Candidatus Hydrogenedens sp.]HPP58489.1 DUF362 domain-containing protein [Candidatus Hydrogenedens sp.]